MEKAQDRKRLMKSDFRAAQSNLKNRQIEYSSTGYVDEISFHRHVFHEKASSSIFEKPTVKFPAFYKLIMLRAYSACIKVIRRVHDMIMQNVKRALQTLFILVFSRFYYSICTHFSVEKRRMKWVNKRRDDGEIAFATASSTWHRFEERNELVTFCEANCFFFRWKNVLWYK